MLFDDLQNFLQVRPGLGILEVRDDRVTTPFTLPGSEGNAPVSVSVRRMEGGYFFVHDDAAVSRLVLQGASPEGLTLFDSCRDAWIERGIAFDEEGRIFTTTNDQAQLGAAVARIIEAQIIAGALARAARR